MGDLDINDQLKADGRIRLNPVPIDADQYREKPDGHTDRELERELLSAIVRGRVDAMALNIRAQAFSTSAHVAFAGLLATLAAEGVSLDAPTITTAIEQRGGQRRGQLLGVLRDVVSAAEVTAPRSAMDRIIELAESRRVHGVLVRAVDAAARGDMVQARALALSVGEADTHATIIEHIADSVGHVIMEAMGRKASTLAPTGISAVDGPIVGLPPGSLTVLGAATGVGKTAAMLAACLAIARQGWHAGYVSCEDPRDVIGGRVLSHESGVPGGLIRAGRIGGAADALMEAAGRIGKMGVHIAYETGATDVSVIQAMTALVRQHGARVIVVDYVQCISAGDSHGDSAHDASRVTSRLKAAAGRLGVALILNSQLSRPKDGEQFKRPHIHKLKESGDIENIADLVLLLWRLSADDDAPVNGYIAKSKWGGGGTEWVMRRKGGLLIEDAT